MVGAASAETGYAVFQIRKSDTQRVYSITVLLAGKSYLLSRGSRKKAVGSGRTSAGTLPQTVPVAPCELL